MNPTKLLELQRFFMIIAHGSPAHRLWLCERIEAFFGAKLDRTAIAYYLVEHQPVEETK